MKTKNTGIKSVEGNTVVINDIDAYNDHLKDVAKSYEHTDTITIKKAKIKNEVLEVEYTEEMADGTNTVKKECTALVHNDLKNSFLKLDEHLSTLCEQYSDAVSCNGFSIGGHDEYEGVTLIGRRELANKRVLNLVSPFQKWEDEFAPYKSISDLKAIIEGCKQEVEKYLFEGKHKPDAQQELPFPE